MGTHAKQQISIHPTNTLFDFVSLIGIDTKSDKYFHILNSFWNSGLLSIDAERQGINMNLNPSEEVRQFSAEELLSFLFTNAMEQATSTIGYELQEAVVAYPSCFNE